MGNPVVMLAKRVRDTRTSKFRDKTYSAAKVRLCMRRSSTSLRLLTRKALWPEGVRNLVFLLEP